LQGAEPRQAVVRQYQVPHVLLGSLAQLLGGFHPFAHHRETARGQGGEHDVRVVLVVLDQQHPQQSSFADHRPYTVKAAPLPGSLAASMRQPCRLTMRWTIASPMPEPWNSSCPCRRWKAPNSFCA